MGHARDWTVQQDHRSGVCSWWRCVASAFWCILDLDFTLGLDVGLPCGEDVERSQPGDIGWCRWNLDMVRCSDFNIRKAFRKMACAFM